MTFKKKIIFANHLYCFFAQNPQIVTKLARFIHFFCVNRIKFIKNNTNATIVIQTNFYNMPLFRYLIILFFLVCVIQSVQATHLRAGQITAVRDANSPNTLTYIFTLTLYRDTQGVDQPDAELGFVPIINGQRRPEIGRLKANANSPRRVVGPNIEEITYTFSFTFPGAGQYVIFFQEENRNAEIVNMNNSVNTPFYIETTLLINQSIGINNTPILRNPPIDGAEVGQKFCHNPAAFDPDGDSLSYKMVVPRQNVNLEVNGYRSPETVGPPQGVSESGGSPTFVINPLTGEICWDAPGPFGVGSKGFAEYNIAFVVEEWRKTSAGYIKVGEVVRDMQITVRDQPNKRPELIIPRDTCVVAGTVLKATIKATDPDANQQIRISSESAIFSVLTSVFPHQPPASLSPANHPPKVREEYVYQGNPAQSQFSWTTDCQHVRSQPYDVVFKAEDNATPAANQLTDTKTWRIRVVGPPPQNLRPTVQADGIRLDWDAYRCANASEILIWRRVGCSADAVDPCPTSQGPAGYTLIGRVRANLTSFTDQTVQSGVQYSYRISANFAPPSGGLSLVSNAVCARLKLTVPLITKVSVQTTDRASGQIDVEWAQPLELDQTAFPGPYRYEVYRATGFSSAFAAPAVYTQTVNSIPSANQSGFYLSFTDTGLNTQDNPYTYVVVLYSNNVKLDSSRTASSVRLSATPLPNQIRLNWTARVPWDNSNQTHTVYRQNPVSKAFEPIATVPVTTAGSFTYTDTGAGLAAGLVTDSVYCYRVQTSGTYSEPSIKSPLLNLSQIVCTTPLDTVRPCAVVLQIDGTDCDLWASQQKEVEANGGTPAFCSISSFTNQLSWDYPTQQGEKVCRESDVVKYRIYYKRYWEDEAFTLIDSVLAPPTPPSKEYFHRNLNSYAGMYYVTAVDQSGNESGPSNIVQKDNCPYYKLPNLITPDNGDTLNQTFKPYPCPRFIESGKITIVNRWGRKVFETTDIQVNWAGGLNTNAELDNSVTPGVYYYAAEVRTMRLRRKDERIVIKGWVQVLK